MVEKEQEMVIGKDSGCVEPYRDGKTHGNLGLLAFTEANWDVRHTGISLDDKSGRLVIELCVSSGRTGPFARNL